MNLTFAAIVGLLTVTFGIIVKVVGFPDHLRLCQMIRAFSVNQFPVRIEPFTAQTIAALIFTEVDITLVINQVKHILDSLLVCRISGSDKIVIGDIEPGPQVSEHIAYLISILFGALPCLLSCRNYLVSVLIRAGQKIGLMACKHMKAV